MELGAGGGRDRVDIRSRREIITILEGDR